MAKLINRYKIFEHDVINTQICNVLTFDHDALGRVSNRDVNRLEKYPVLVACAHQVMTTRVLDRFAIRDVDGRLPADSYRRRIRRADPRTRTSTRTRVFL